MRSGRQIFFSSLTPEKLSTAKSKRRISQLLQPAGDPPSGSQLDFTRFALLWHLGGCLALAGGQDLAQNSTDSEPLSLGLDSHFPLYQEAASPTPPRAASHPSTFPALVCFCLSLFPRVCHKLGGVAHLALTHTNRHQGCERTPHTGSTAAFA